jgi:DNA segregation ATPase FtsK/SpoIIIE-like protein
MTQQDPQGSPLKAPVTAPTDDLLQRAILVVLTHGQASISLIQRRLRIGYSKALVLMDAMAGANIVSRDVKDDGHRAILLSYGDQCELILKLQAGQVDDSRDPSTSQRFFPR